MNFFGMQPCERSDRVPEDKTAHTLLLAGQYKGLFCFQVQLYSVQLTSIFSRTCYTSCQDFIKNCWIIDTDINTTYVMLSHYEYYFNLFEVSV